MANQLIEIETSNDFFCGGDREININSKREKEKHLTLLSRPGKPHESNLDLLVSPTPWHLLRRIILRQVEVIVIGPRQNAGNL